MAADRTYIIEGATACDGRHPAGRRIVQVRDLDGTDLRLHELYTVRENGDWDYVDTVGAAEAIDWLTGADR